MPPEGPARGQVSAPWLAGRVSEGGSVFVWGAREAARVGRGRERSAGRWPRTLTQAAHAREPPTQAAFRWSLPLPLTGALAERQRVRSFLTGAI